MPRCFIAFPASPEVKNEIQRIQEEIKRLDPSAPLKFTASDDVHVTLEFLGELDQVQVNSVKSILSAVCYNYSAFNFVMDQIGAFPNFDRPNVLVVSAKDDSGFGSAIQKEINGQLQRKNLVINNGRFWKPHLTVARAKAAWPRASMLQEFAVEKINWLVDRIILFESILDPEGPSYFSLGEYRLKS